jgi:hypothetical protein
MVSIAQRRKGTHGSYRRESRVATSEETPATITAARAKLEPVPPEDKVVTIVATMTAVVNRVRECFVSTGHQQACRSQIRAWRMLDTEAGPN